MGEFKKGDVITYKPWGGNDGEFVKARVIRARRDGSILVEPWFFVDANGDATGSFIGGSVPVPSNLARATQGGK